MNASMAPTPRRMKVLGVFVMAPAVAAALGLSAMEIYRLVEPNAPVFGSPPRSLAEAIIGGFGAEEQYLFIRDGQDPNEPILVDHRGYSGRRPIKVPPLMLAVAARDSSAVLMLLAFGARLDLPQTRRAACLAQEVGNDEIADILARQPGGDVPPSCSRRPDAATPLLAWLE